MESLIRVVEIKSDEDQDEDTPAKAEYTRAHFERVSNKFQTVNISDINKQYRNNAKQHYTFDLLTPNEFTLWFADLKNGSKGIRLWVALEIFKYNL